MAGFDPPIEALPPKNPTNNSQAEPPRNRHGCRVLSILMRNDDRSDTQPADPPQDCSATAEPPSSRLSHCPRGVNSAELSRGRSVASLHDLNPKLRLLRCDSVPAIAAKAERLLRDPLPRPHTSVWQEFGSFSNVVLYGRDCPTVTTVDFEHRDRTAANKQEDYQQLHDQLVEGASELPGIHSIVTCGSLVKATLVPGWSDLDIIVFCKSTVKQWALLNDVSGMMSELSRAYSIGVGIDFVSIDSFRRTLRLGGRPLAMSREVAGYGRISFGPDPFERLVWSEEYFEAARVEALNACRATIHNWRRHVVARWRNDDPARNLQYDTKVGLKLLKCESDPNTGPSYTYDTALRNVQRIETDRFPPQLFEECVKTRKAWGHVAHDQGEILALGLRIPEMLSRYREP